MVRINSSLDSLLLQCYTDDWKSIFGDPTKFGFGILTVIFAALLLLQHLLYRSNSNATPTETDNMKSKQRVCSKNHTFEEGSIQLENQTGKKNLTLYNEIIIIFYCRVVRKTLVKKGRR